MASFYHIKSEVSNAAAPPIGEAGAVPVLKHFGIDPFDGWSDVGGCYDESQVHPSFRGANGHE
jgi:hypothetical protein